MQEVEERSDYEDDVEEDSAAEQEEEDAEEEEYEDYTDPSEENAQWVDGVMSSDNVEQPSKRQCTEARVKELEEANAELRTQLERAQRKIEELRRAKTGPGEPSTSLVASAQQPVSISPSLRSPSNRTIVLRQIIRTPNGRNLEDIAMPYRFSDTGSFPHAVGENVKKRTREYQVESRRLTNFTFALFYDEDGSPATEKDIKTSGDVMMQMSMLYADDYSEVHTAHFTRAVVNSLVTPSSELNSEKTLKNGEVSYSVRFNIQSTETAPRHRSFVMRVGPSKGDEKYNENLVCYTPPFIVRSKVTAPTSSARDSLVVVGVAPQNTPVETDE